MEYTAPPQFQNPDILGAYLRGRMAPGALQLQQQQVAEGQIAQQEAPLRLDMLRQQLGMSQWAMDMAQRETGGNAPQGSPGTPSESQPQGQPANDNWGPGQILGHNVSNSGLSNQALGWMSVAEGKEDPISAHLKATQADASDLANRKEVLATKMLDPTQPNNGIPFAIQLANMPSGSAQALKNNPAFLQQWEQHARNAGVNPGDIYSPDPTVADYAVKRVAYATAMPALQAVGKEGLIHAPQHTKSQVLGGVGLVQTDESTGKTDITNTPTYSAQDTYDPNTGHKGVKLVQTGGLFGGGGRASGGMASGGGGGTDLGPTAPTPDNQKDAGFALMFRTGVNTAQKLEQSGYQFSPKARGIVLDAATSEGGLDKYVPGSAIFKQWLVKNQLTQKDQEYMASIMPMLQAVGHKMAAARLTTSQMRTNFESILPQGGMSADGMAQVNANRDAMYRGMLAESGSASQLPEFRDTIGADRQRIANPQSAPSGGNVPVMTPEQARSAPKGTRFKTTDGRIMVKK